MIIPRNPYSHYQLTRRRMLRGREISLKGLSTLIRDGRFGEPAPSSFVSSTKLPAKVFFQSIFVGLHGLVTFVPVGRTDFPALFKILKRIDHSQGFIHTSA